MMVVLMIMMIVHDFAKVEQKPVQQDFIWTKYPNKKGARGYPTPPITHNVSHPSSRDINQHYFPPRSVSFSTSLFTERMSKQVAVQNTGLVMQWCPFQLPSLF